LKIILSIRNGEEPYSQYQSRNIMLFSRSFEGVFSLVALNFGAEEQVVYFKFPSEGNYRAEIHGLDNLNGVSAGEELQLLVPSNYGKIWTLEV
jgi:maltooligosyltrehalose trehalohydrolase